MAYARKPEEHERPSPAAAPTCTVHKAFLSVLLQKPCYTTQQPNNYSALYLKQATSASVIIVLSL